ncbi:MAG: peroxiredoxin [Candidatus Thermoplasmatota archaeon]|nr:peroxiredoxin [Candidatus Thermoplasmatota archaeon]MCL5437808.1 peroxiredoxin [Candidatus Thermoplasmatota archaeon]
MTLQVGTNAPDFTLKDHDGRDFRLSEHVGKQEIVLYFYPKDETPGCVAEACSFRDHWDDFMDSGSMVIGVSSDTEESHRKFIEHRKLQFPLLSDSDKTVRKLYDCAGFIIPKRVTYIIDKEGKIRGVFDSQMNTSGHVESALKVIASIRESSR